MRTSRPPRRPPARRCPALALLLAAVLAVGCSSAEPNPPDLRAPGPAAMPRVPALGDDAQAPAVRDLASHDFETRARAARRLVEAGDASLPALGRAGDLPVPVAGGLRVSATGSVVAAILARSQDEALEQQHLGSPWPNVRRAAAEELGRRGRWASIPRLIERLEDRDPAVRQASAVSLRRMTNRFLGYRADASLDGRRQAADRWRTWWEEEGRAEAGRSGLPSARAR